MAIANFLYWPYALPAMARSLSFIAVMAFIAAGTTAPAGAQVEWNITGIAAGV